MKLRSDLQPRPSFTLFLCHTEQDLSSKSAAQDKSCTPHALAQDKSCTPDALAQDKSCTPEPKRSALKLRSELCEINNFPHTETHKHPEIGQFEKGFYGYQSAHLESIQPIEIPRKVHQEIQVRGMCHTG